MKNNIELSTNASFTYIIIYYSDDKFEDIKPIVYGSREEFIKQQVTYHLFSDELFGFVEVFSKIIQLPRGLFDLYRVSLQTLTDVKNHSHNIIHIPQYLVDEIISKASLGVNGLYNPTLLIYDERCLNEVLRFEEVISTSLGKMRFVEFNDLVPKDIWKRLQDLHSFERMEKLQIPNLAEFLTNDELNVLPSFFYLIQNDDFDRYVRRDKDAESAFSFNNRILDEYNIRMMALKSTIENRSDDKEKNDNHYKEQVKYLRQYNHKPLVITLPGIPNHQKRCFRNIDVKENNITERYAIKNIGLYRAMARSAAYLELNYMGQELYNIVYKLEKHCMGNISNKFVWRSLKRFGDIIAKKLSDQELKLLTYSNQITYYSDLPLGIAILPGATSPLICYTSLSANNLTPLSRLYQTELPKQEGFFISGKLKVIIAECISKDDKIRELSDAGWNGIRDNFRNNENIDIFIEETNTVYKLKKFLRSNTDANVLIISAHGHYDLVRKISGIIVGNEFWNANENDFRVPKVVILSSCHVSPRGVGAINISDLFIRTGAQSVIGTLIPINTYKNAIFMQRLLVYMIESFSIDKPKSLDEIWMHVVSSNAILEIVHSSKKLVKWAFSRNSDSVSPIEKFMLGESKIDLRAKHIYQDSVNRLIDIAKGDGMDHYVKAVIDSQGFFPESIFYILYGKPELILFGKGINKLA
ncbi:MAG: hypothetical protein A2017_17500 [Lentisphaerae bacterium GWF2_44_16]|nr:MAG: hypothetical protein A2017_17500 [Lentisphaerae bacterium GWF2_44_16]HAU65891.1 hypothetical protein [Candidatus Uhrbacteria bacterium]